jgi:DNA-binding HxlR family transcriptional regulator
MSRRTYNQYCGLAQALDVVGERWTLLIVRNLILGQLRYSDLLRGLPGITTNLLAKRLREMEEAGLIERVEASGAAYRLTKEGAALEPALRALGAWGMRRMGAPQRGEFRSFEFLLLLLRLRYRGGASLRAELVASGAPFRLSLAPDRVSIVRGTEESPDVRVSGEAQVLAKMFLESGWSAKPPKGIEVEGSTKSYQSLIGAFEPQGQPGAARAGAA